MPFTASGRAEIVRSLDHYAEGFGNLTGDGIPSRPPVPAEAGVVQDTVQAEVRTRDDGGRSPLLAADRKVTDAPARRGQRQRRLDRRRQALTTAAYAETTPTEADRLACHLLGWFGQQQPLPNDRAERE